LKPKPDSYRFLIEYLFDTFADNQIVLDDHGTPVDYIFAVYLHDISEQRKNIAAFLNNDPGGHISCCGWQV
jgi:hypothetical protein